MRTFPIIGALLGVWLVSSCGFPSGETVPKTEYDEVVSAYEELRNSAEATREEYLTQAQAVDNILQELTRISGRTATLRTDLEQGTARITQVEMIEDNLDGIRQQLSELDRLTRENAQYGRVVASLKAVVAEKEKEIEGLRAEIQAKDRTISEQNEKISAQHGTIVLQNETITAQQEHLEKAVREQARMLFEAGRDFEQLGDDSPTVSRRKDRAKVTSLTLDMYEKALLYYSKAAETGYPEAANRMEEVKGKMAVLTQ